MDVELLDVETNTSVSQTLIEAGYADSVEPIIGGNTSRFIKESTMTSLLVDSSRVGDSMLVDVTGIPDVSQLDDQMVLLVASVEGDNPDDFTCVLAPEQDGK